MSRPPRRGLRHARFQRSLAVAAIAAAVALPVVLISVGGGVSDHEIHALQNAGYQIVVSAPGVHGVTGAHALADRIDRIAGVVESSPVLSVAVDAFNGTGAVSPVLAEGVEPGPFGATLGPTEAGLFPLPLPLGDPTDSVHYDHGRYAGAATDDVIVSVPYEQRFRVGVGSTISLAATDNASAAVRFNVTGTFGPPVSLLSPTAAFAIVLPLSDLQLLTGYANGTSVVVADAADSIEVEVNGTAAAQPATVARIAAEVQALVPAYSVTTLSQEASQLEAAAAVLTGFYLALSSVGVVVGVLFLTLVLLRRVDAERRSIGIRRAMGVSSASIAGGIAADGAWLAGAGGAAGVVAGYAIVVGLARWATGTVQEAASLAVFAPLTLAEIVVGIGALSLAASAVATRRALRLPVAEALR